METDYDSQIADYDSQITNYDSQIETLIDALETAWNKALLSDIDADYRKAGVVADTKLALEDKRWELQKKQTLAKDQLQTQKLALAAKEWKLKQALEDKERQLKKNFVESTPTPTPTPTPNIKDFETLLAQNQGPSSPIKYYEDLNKGKGGYAPDPGAGRPGNVRLKNPPLASDTQEVNIAAGDKDSFLNKAEQLLGDLKASKDAKAAETRERKRNESGNLAQTTELLKNLNFFGDDESSGDASLIAAEYRPTPVPEPPDRLSPNMRGARNYGRENPGKYNPFLPDNVNRHFMGLPPV